jgi:hypothetical protein
MHAPPTDTQPTPPEHIRVTPSGPGPSAARQAAAAARRHTAPHRRVRPGRPWCPACRPSSSAHASAAGRADTGRPSPAARYSTAGPAWRATCYSLAARKCTPSQRAQHRHAGTPSQRARTEERRAGAGPGRARPPRAAASRAQRPTTFRALTSPPATSEPGSPSAAAAAVLLLQAAPPSSCAPACRPCPRTAWPARSDHAHAHARAILHHRRPCRGGLRAAAAATLPQRNAPSQELLLQHPWGNRPSSAQPQPHPPTPSPPPARRPHAGHRRRLAGRATAHAHLRSGAEGVGTSGDGEEREGMGECRSEGEEERGQEGKGGGKGDDYLGIKITFTPFFAKS